MDRLYAANTSNVPPVVPFPGSYGFSQGNEYLTQFAPTNPGAFWFHYITESMLNVITAAGMTPDPHDLTQFGTAVATIITQARS